MQINYYNNLESLYTELHESVAHSSRPPLNEKVKKLTAYSHQNAEDLASDLSDHTELGALYQKITVDLQQVGIPPQEERLLKTMENTLGQIGKA